MRLTGVSLLVYQPPSMLKVLHYITCSTAVPAYTFIVFVMVLINIDAALIGLIPHAVNCILQN